MGQAWRECREELETAAKHALPPIRKALAQTFVHELKVETRECVIPTFKVIGVAHDEPAAGERIDSPIMTVGVRPMSPFLAVPTGFEPVSPP